MKNYENMEVHSVRTGKLVRKQRSPKLEQAVHWLLTNLTHKPAPHSILGLSKEAGVSSVTMHKAISVLKNRGFIEAVHANYTQTMLSLAPWLDIMALPPGVAKPKITPKKFHCPDCGNEVGPTDYKIYNRFCRTCYYSRIEF